MAVIHFQHLQVQLKVLYVEVSGRTNSLLQYFCMMALTNSSHPVTEYKDHLQLKCSTVKWTTLLCLMYSSQAAKLIHGGMTTI